MKAEKRHTHRHFHFDEFTVLEVFLAVAMFGLIAGATFTVLFPELATRTPIASVASVPSSSEYRSSASVVMAPFLTQAARMDVSDFSSPSASEIRTFVVRTREAMLTLRVPPDMRDTHLHAVLLLDRWVRALSGDAASADGLIQATASFSATYPWLTVAEPNPL